MITFRWKVSSEKLSRIGELIIRRGAARARYPDHDAVALNFDQQNLAQHRLPPDEQTELRGLFNSGRGGGFPTSASVGALSGK